MELTLGVRAFGPRKVRCSQCAQPMWLVGIEAHPELPDLVDLVTYECACGEVVAKPHLTNLTVGSFPAAS
jgi:hypothetical protein